jgi:hypothetical protein
VWIRFIWLGISHLRVGLPNGVFSSGFASNILYPFLMLPYVLHAHFILLDMIILAFLEEFK